MSDLRDELLNLKPTKDFLVAIDSDGCVFDSMEIKHKECFIPNIIKYWKLQAVSKYARAASEFINLYSKWRGVNRFPALTMTFDLLKEWPEVQMRRVEIPEAKPLRDWIARETKLGNPTLKAEATRTGDPTLKLTLEWSEAINRTVEDMVEGVPPFPFFRESIEKVVQWADIIVCSSTPMEALRREWAEHDIAKYTRVILGQEVGSKKEILQLAIDSKYDKSRVLMIGDAPGDMKAAQSNHARFLPINPGAEEASWELFFMEAAEKFHRGEYSGDYECGLIADFERRLPEVPPWKK
jgi:phosphoglycolate phosphatase-like HAD superfamily hydrolase